MFGGSGTIAVDIGSRYIKMVHGKKKGNGISIINYGMCETPESSYTNGSISDRERIRAALYNLFAQRNFRSRDVFLGLSGQDLIIRHVEMPVMPDKQLKKAVELEIQQYLPMNTNEYIIDSKKLDKIDTKDKKMLDVLLVAAPRLKVQEYMCTAESLGLKVKAIDIFSNSMTRLLDTNKEKSENEGCTVLLDIGYSTTNVTLIENGKLFLEREIDIGTRDINGAIEDAFGDETDDVEEIQHTTIRMSSGRKIFSNHDSRIYYANSSTRQIINNLAEDLLKILDFYVSSSYNRKIGCIYLYGGGATIKGIGEYIESLLNINTRLFDTGALHYVYKVDSGLKKDIYLYVNCIGMLLRRD